MLDLLRHFFVPHHTNNQKAKLLHNSTLLSLSLCFVLVQGVINLLPKTGVDILGYASQISVDEVIRLTNEKRTQNGLSALSINSKLSSAAYLKGTDMINRDYWAHVAPDGTQPWKFFGDVAYKYRYAGENLARDFSNASSAVDAWMASPTHRDNILSAKYQEIGIAVVEGDLNGVDTTIIVQLFGAQVSGVATTTKTSLATNVQAKTIATSPSPKPTVSPTPSIYPYEKVVSYDNELPVSAKTRKVSPLDLLKMLSYILLISIIVVLLFDVIIVYRRKIPRVSGKTLAHLSFLLIILIIIIIIKAGNIL